jgi:hypothetical protein
MEERKCVCGGVMHYAKGVQRNGDDIYMCLPCGVSGRSYAGALRTKIRREMLNVRDMRREAKALLSS